MMSEERAARAGASSDRDGTAREELQYRLRQQELLSEFGMIALTSRDIPFLLQEATRLCAEGLHTTLCKIMEYLPDEDQFVVRAGVGWKPGVIGARTGADLENPAGHAFRTGEPTIANAIEGDRRYRLPRMLADHGVRRAINVVIATHDRRYGIIEGDSRGNGRFTEADVAFMQGFANLLGVAFERQQSEARLRHAHARNDEILESISDAFYAVDHDWRFTYVNRKAEEWWSRSRENLIGKVYWEEFPQAVGSEAYEAHQAAMRERVAVHHETVSPILGHWVDIDIHPTAAGGLGVYFRDITERKRTEAALRASEQRLEFLVQLGDRLRNLTDPVEVALAAAGLLGQHLGAARAGYGEIDGAQEIVSVKRDWTDGTVGSLAGEARIPGAFGPEVIAKLRAGRTLVVEDCLTDPRAGEAHLATWTSIAPRSLIVVPLVQGERLRAIFYVHEAQPRRWTGEEATLARDVAERTWDAVERSRTETALRASETLKRTILESALDCIVTATADSRVVEWNPAAERTFGFAASEALGRDLAQLIIPPEFRERHYKGMAHYLATGEGPVLGRRIELEALRADGSRFPVELAITPTHIEGHAYFTAYLRDISERKQAEAALRDREQRLRATYESAFAGIAEVDPDGRFLRVNEELCRLTGYSREELRSLSFRDITVPEDLWRDREQFERQMAGDIGAYRIEKRFIHRNGSQVWVDLSASRVDDDQGRPLYGVRVLRDITERRRAEEHRELLIHELNHRVKNTLATVQSIAAQSLRNASTAEEAREAMEARLFALAGAHDVLTRENWEGAGLREIVGQAMAPYRSARENRLHMAGSEVRLPPRMALAIAMALQELATNAVKYGALSNTSGEIRIAWAVGEEDGERRVRLTWTESGGPPVEAPTRRGFGTRLIERSLAQDLNGRATIAFAPSGVICTAEAPLLDSSDLPSK